MKKIIVFLCLLSVFIVVINCKKENQIEINDNELFINGKEIEIPWDLQTVLNIIGKYDRVSKLANNIYTYDNNGILVYEEPGSSKVSSIDLYWVKTTYPFSSKQVFSGTFIVNKIPYTGQTTIEQISKNMVKYKTNKTIDPKCNYYTYSVNLKRINIIFHFNPKTMEITNASLYLEK